MGQVSGAQKHLLRGATVILTLCLLALGCLCLRVWQVTRQPGITVRWLPPKEWFSSGMIADGTDRVVVTEVWGCIEITRTSPR